MSNPQRIDCEHRCAMKGCRRPCGIQKGRRTPYRYCFRHRSQLAKEKNPTRYYYNIFKQHAKRRKVEFRIPFEFYAKLVEQSGWTEEKRGRTLMDYSIDRIDTNGIYEPSNVRVCTISENAAKHTKPPKWLNCYGPYAIGAFSGGFPDEVASDAAVADDDTDNNCPF